MLDFNNVKIEDLTDIRKIKIDKNQPQSKRQAAVLKTGGKSIYAASWKYDD